MATLIDKVSRHIERALPRYAEVLKGISTSCALSNIAEDLDAKIAKCQRHINYLQHNLPHKVGAKSSRFTVRSKHDQITIAQNRLALLKEVRCLFSAKIAATSKSSLVGQLTPSKNSAFAAPLNIKEQSPGSLSRIANHSDRPNRVNRQIIFEGADDDFSPSSTSPDDLSFPWKHFIR